MGDVKSSDGMVYSTAAVDALAVNVSKAGSDVMATAATEAMPWMDR